MLNFTMLTNGNIKEFKQGNSYVFVTLIHIYFKILNPGTYTDVYICVYAHMYVCMHVLVLLSIHSFRDLIYLQLKHIGFGI